VRIRRIASAASTIVVAIVVALAVPTSQLRTFTVVEQCCCPDPSNCHCPHDADRSTQPSMRVCHKTQHEIVSPEAPAFAAPQVALVTSPARVIALAPAPIPAPHVAPVLARPDAPS
jgi:hypothetical protein